MNLRTIKCWVIYDPANKQVIASRRFKYEIERLRIPAHWMPLPALPELGEK